MTVYIAAYQWVGNVSAQWVLIYDPSCSSLAFTLTKYDKVKGIMN